MKAFILKIYNKLYYVPSNISFLFFSILNFFVRKFKKPPHVMNIDETIDYIIEKRPSIARFGDGEIKLVNQTDISFQKASPKLSAKLKEALLADEENFLPCIINFFYYDNEINDETNAHWQKHMKRYRHVWYKNTKSEITYGNAYISRLYISLNDKKKVAERFKKIKAFWQDRNMIIVEGEQSRLGVNNDLFDNANSVRRILCPTNNAFDSYERIFEAVKKQAKKDDLLLLAIGPTATALAYDLSKCGFQALDIGHIDIEYEWFKAGAKTKQPVKNKFVNEAGAGQNIESLTDRKYLDEIVEIIK